jgi:dTDP-4-amino-4,6-dideoxygalactose transaminase
MGIMRKYTPVASDLPIHDVMAARKSAIPIDECLQEIGTYLGTRHLFPAVSGRAALYAILKATLSDKSKVVLPGYTCYTLPAAVIRAGMIPVLSDSRKTDFGYDPDKLRGTMTKHPDIKAIVVCHLFGIALDINEIRNIAGPEVMIIDDAAQGFGIKADGEFLGNGGEVGFYSFGRGKNLSLVGGGLIVTKNDALAEKIKGVIDSEFSARPGSSGEFLRAASYNRVIRPGVFSLLSRLPGMKLGRSIFDPDFVLSRLSDFKIRLLHRIYGIAEKLNSDRLEVSCRYLSFLDGNDSITIPKSSLDNSPGSLRFPVLVKDPANRSEVLRIGAKCGWGLSSMYPTTLNKIKQLPPTSEDELAGSESIARSIITLPTHHHIQSGGNILIEKISGLLA